MLSIYYKWVIKFTQIAWCLALSLKIIFCSFVFSFRFRLLDLNRKGFLFPIFQIRLRMSIFAAKKCDIKHTTELIWQCIFAERHQLKWPKAIKSPSDVVDVSHDLSDKTIFAHTFPVDEVWCRFTAIEHYIASSHAIYTFYLNCMCQVRGISFELLHDLDDFGSMKRCDSLFFCCCYPIFYSQSQTIKSFVQQIYFYYRYRYIYRERFAARQKKSMLSNCCCIVYHSKAQKTIMWKSCLKIYVSIKLNHFGFFSLSFCYHSECRIQFIHFQMPSMRTDLQQIQCGNKWT